MIDTAHTHDEHRTLYVDFESDRTPTCEEHGTMEPFTPVVLRDGRVHVPREMADIRACRACCSREIATKAGAPVEPEAAVRLVWRDFLDDQWNGHVERMFSVVGDGRFDDGVAVVTDPVDDVPPVAVRNDRVVVVD